MTKRELKIESPCHMQWAELKGAGAKRFCGECALHVVDGSAMTKSAAEALVESADGRVCMRVAVDEEGQAIHRAESQAVRPNRLAGIGLTIVSTMLAACGDDPLEQAPPEDPPTENPHSTPSVDTGPERPHEVMGGMVYVEEDPMELLGEIAWEEPVSDQNEADGKDAVAPEGPQE